MRCSRISSNSAGLRVRQVAQDSVLDHVEAPVLALALVDLADHVALEAVGELLDAARHAHAAVERARGQGPAQEEPLQQIDPQLQGHDRLGVGLDPLRHHQRADAAAQVHQALERLLLVEVVAHAADQAAVDLDHVGTKQRDPIEVGVPGADVVQHHQEAMLPQRVRQRAEAADVLQARLQELHRDVAGQQVRSAAPAPPAPPAALRGRRWRRDRGSGTTAARRAGPQAGKRLHRGLPAKALERGAEAPRPPPS